MLDLLDILQFQQFDNLELVAREIVEGFITGLHRSPFHGFSVEFAEHRLYNKGESTRHIDWKLYGRTEKLFLKQFEEETNLRCQLIIDTSSSMLYPGSGKKDEILKSKLAFSVYSCAALAYLLKRQRDAVGLTTFSEQINFHIEPHLTSVHIDLIFGKLRELIVPDSLKMKKGTSVVPVLHQIAESIHQRSLIIIFSDMVSEEEHDELFSALQHLRYNKHEVILFHVTDNKMESELQFSNRPHRFVDLETGEHVKMNPADLRKAYSGAIKKYLNELTLKCHQYQIDLVEADINKDFHHVLWAFLVKRKKLF